MDCRIITVLDVMTTIMELDPIVDLLGPDRDQDLTETILNRVTMAAGLVVMGLTRIIKKVNLITMKKGLDIGARDSEVGLGIMVLGEVTNSLKAHISSSINMVVGRMEIDVGHLDLVVVQISNLKVIDVNATAINLGQQEDVTVVKTLK